MRGVRGEWRTLDTADQLDPLSVRGARGRHTLGDSGRALHDPLPRLPRRGPVQRPDAGAGCGGGCWHPYELPYRLREPVEDARPDHLVLMASRRCLRPVRRDSRGASRLCRLPWAQGMKPTPPMFKRLRYNRHEPRPEVGLWILPAAWLIGAAILAYATWTLREIR